MKTAALVIVAALLVGAGAGVGGYFIGHANQTGSTGTSRAPVAGPSVLCQDALARRAQAERALSDSPPMSSGLGNSGNAYLVEREDARAMGTKQRAAADGDVKTYCR